MHRYPEADLHGEIVSLERHPAIETVTVLQVRSASRGDTATIYVFEGMDPDEDMKGLCMRADVLALPQESVGPGGSGPLVAMEWCIHEVDGTMVRCTPGWSENEKPVQRIEIAPQQI